MKISDQLTEHDRLINVILCLIRLIAENAYPTSTLRWWQLLQRLIVMQKRRKLERRLFEEMNRHTNVVDHPPGLSPPIVS